MMQYQIDWRKLRAYCEKLLQTQGMTENDAFTVADSLVDADLCGVGSHGVSRMAIYMERLATKVVSSGSNVKVEREYPGSYAVNACNTMGMVAGKLTMELCIKKAKENGCCFAAVNHSNHFGMASYYVRMAAEADMIGFAGTNAPPNIAPWGSSRAYCGTNPLAISAPTKGDPIILDMAPSVVAMGKVILAAKLGKSIPEGWAITKDGKPTTDPKEGVLGSVLPIGGAKGYGLALFMDILCGILSGAQFGPHINNMFHDFEHPQDVGHVFCAVDISKFTEVSTFKARMAQMIGEIKKLPSNEGISELFVPGEIEQRNKKRQKESGVELHETVYSELTGLGEKYGVPIWF